MSSLDYEKSFVEAFVKPEFKDRWFYMLATKKRRAKQLCRLYHHFDFTADIIERFKGSAESLATTLRLKGALSEVYHISVIPSIDGRLLPFSVEECGYDATVYILIPRKLVVFCDEYDLYILENLSAG